MKFCDNNVKNHVEGSKCNNIVPKGFFSSSRYLKGSDFSLNFCSGKCREEYKNFYNIKVYDHHA